jgi:DNA-binding transcriptional regulator PaaX
MCENKRYCGVTLCKFVDNNYLVWRYNLDSNQRSNKISYRLLDNSISQARRQREFIYTKTKHFKQHISQLPYQISETILRNAVYLSVITNHAPDNSVCCNPSDTILPHSAVTVKLLLCPSPGSAQFSF